MVSLCEFVVWVFVLSLVPPHILHHDFHLLTHLLHLSDLFFANLHNEIFHVQFLLLLLFFPRLLLFFETVQLRNPLL